ncbi:MAG TPA: LacI family DNA-binding transcriptional regulator [Kiritimatiellia bacterium]|nr:LacI family DNA-binding transcriptional regulator [Kiritimatiellia bacterium]
MATTLKDIAARTGLSLPTVSHILSARGGAYREETRNRVLAAASALGYRPNASARAVRAGRFGNVILLMSSDPGRSGLFPALAHGMLDALDAQALRLTISRLPDAQLTDERTLPGVLRTWMGDGLLILYTAKMPARLIELVRRFRIPAVWVNADLPRDSVYPDEKRAAFLATRRLLQAQPGPVYYGDFTYGARAPDAHFSARARYAGYAQAVREAGRRPLRMGLATRLEREDRLPWLAHWLPRQPRPLGVLCVAASTALPLCHAAAQQGRVIGRDLAVSTFGDAPVTLNGIALDTWIVPMHEMGRRAVERLLARIENPRSAASLRLPLDHAPGESVPGARA